MTRPSTRMGLILAGVLIAVEDEPHPGARSGHLCSFIVEGGVGTRVASEQRANASRARARRGRRNDPIESGDDEPNVPSSEVSMS